MIQPCLFFGGRCEEVLQFYGRALGTHLEVLVHYMESAEPPPPGMLTPGFEDNLRNDRPAVEKLKAFTGRNAFGRSGFPFTWKEYTTPPPSVELARVEVPNALWHQPHTFTCFAYPTYEPHHHEQIGAALKKVIRAYAK